MKQEKQELLQQLKDHQDYLKEKEKLIERMKEEMSNLQVQNYYINVKYLCAVM
jgi:hypothetical protein